MDTVVRDLRNAPRMPGVERIWLPGEQSYERRRRYAEHGIPLSAGVMGDLAVVAAELGLAPLVTLPSAA